MGTVFVIVIIVLTIIYLLAQDSNKETTKEKYGDAVGQLAHSAADSISGIATSITEPANKKKVRLAKEELAHRHGSLYRYDWYSNKHYLEELLTVDDKLKQALQIVGLPEDRWKKLALRFFYLGAIRQLSRDNNDYTQRISKSLRVDMMENWPNGEDWLKIPIDILKRALKYFGISEEEWVNYGDAVIEMYNLENDPDMKEFGYIDAIKPMKNNRHLL